MRIFYVAVDALPDSCTKCQFQNHWHEDWVRCSFVEDISMPIEVASVERPEFCPLIAVKPKSPQKIMGLLICDTDLTLEVDNNAN